MSELQTNRLELIGTMAVGVAHDFNNLLMLIVNHVHAAAGEVDVDDAAFQHLEHVRKAARRGADLAQFLLKFGAPSGSDFDRVDVARVMKEVVDGVRRSAHPSIQVGSAIEEGLAIRGNATQLWQILVNLALNGCQSMVPKGGKLMVTASACPGGVVMSVRDNGRGIRAEDKERIFEPFFSTRKGEGGNGMGLAMVAALVKSHGGTIDVLSEIGLGTTFLLRFPAAMKE